MHHACPTLLPTEQNVLVTFISVWWDLSAHWMEWAAERFRWRTSHLMYTLYLVLRSSWFAIQPWSRWIRSDPIHTVQLSHSDLREWDGGSLQPYHVITGTPPYFPKAHFVASQNHSQKVRCRVPTRGAASDYVAAAARLIRKPDGIICIAETARKEGEDGMWEAIRKHGLHVLRRLDVISRTGLPPRFSCWLLTTKDFSTDHGNTDHQETLSTRDNNIMIETLTIRNEDQSRTLEYVEAMESMGWVDFEMTKEKMTSTVEQEASGPDQ
jgi:hypothetical protein